MRVVDIHPLKNRLHNVNPNCYGGGGGIEPRNAKISEKCLYSHHNNTVLIKEYPCLILS